MAQINTDFLKQLIDAAEQYSGTLSSPESADLGQFAVWMQSKAPNIISVDPSGHKQQGSETIDSSIAKYITFLSRYAKLYTKRLLEGQILQSIDEFVMLITLLKREAVTKSELLEMCRIEKPTGMEILRRLSLLQLIAQRNHDSDKRSQLIMLTPQGRDALFSVIGRFDALALLMTGNLTDTEKLELKRLLEKLELYHTPLRIAAKRGNWEEIERMRKEMY
jgi:MarR family transcriptional regulator, lower aerobic nicotinate degradation pathway regulator